MQSYEILRQNSEPMSEFIEIPAEARRTFYLGMGAWIEDGIDGLWYEPGTSGHSDPNHLAVQIGDRFSSLSQFYNAASTGSPIEDQMAGVLLWLDVDWAGFPKIDYVEGPEETEIHRPSEGLEFWITSQARIGKYRADFLLWFQLGRHAGGVAIECDGHAFHEKSKEQASRDKARDRAFLRAGFPVMRFSGSDIFRDPLACASEIKEALEPILNRVSKDGGLF